MPAEEEPEPIVDEIIKSPSKKITATLAPKKKVEVVEEVLARPTDEDKAE